MKSNYFILSHISKKEIIGSDYPQSYSFTKEYNPNSKNAIFELYKYKTDFPNFIPNLDGIKLSNKAKLTDFISNSFGEYIVSPKVKDILEKYILCPHRFYKIKLHHKKVVYDYFLLKIISNYSHYVDYAQSTFVEYDYFHKGEIIPIKSIEDLLSKRKELKDLYPDKNITIWADHIIFNSEFQANIDFFEIGIIDSKTYISEKLYEDFLTSSVTGIEYEQIVFQISN